MKIVVAQHKPGHFVGHRRQQHIAFGPGQPVVAHGVGQRDLDVDLDV